MQPWVGEGGRRENACILRTDLEKSRNLSAYHIVGVEMSLHRTGQRAGHVSSPYFQVVCPLSYLFSKVLSGNGPNLNESFASVSKQFQRINRTVADPVFSPIHCMSQRLEVT